MFTPAVSQRMTRLLPQEPVRTDPAHPARGPDRLACSRLLDLHRGPRAGRARRRWICNRPAHRQSHPPRPGHPARGAATHRRRLERSELPRLALRPAAGHAGSRGDDDASLRGDQGLPCRSAVARHRAAAARVGILVDGRAAIRSLAHDGAWPHDAWLRRIRGLPRICKSPSLWRMASGCHLRPPCRQAARRISASVPALDGRHGDHHPRRVGVGGAPCHRSPRLIWQRPPSGSGNDVNAPPLPETGTIETRQAARAFNDMQTRLRNLIENRTRLLAAISHDLRTPLTLLRLRAETVENTAGAGQDAVHHRRDGRHDRHHAAVRPRRQRKRASDADRPHRSRAKRRRRDDAMPAFRFACSRQRPFSIECQPAALKRAVRNLLDNAVKYGKSGSAEIRVAARAVEIDIDDDGPGIPEAGARACAGAVLPARGIAQPRDGRGRPRARHRALDRPGPRRQADARATGPAAACAPA